VDADVVEEAELFNFWIHRDDAEKLNAVANRTPDEARRSGRYVLENGEHVDVLLARAVQSKATSELVSFDDVWARRRELVYAPGIRIAVPTIPDLIRTKQWALRDRDIADIRLLEAKLQEGME
jgi:hypothetical protein